MGSRHHQTCAKEEEYCDETEEPDDHDDISVSFDHSDDEFSDTMAETGWHEGVATGTAVDAVKAVTAWLACGFGGGWVWQSRPSKGVRLNAVEWGGTWRKSTATRSELHSKTGEALLENPATLLVLSAGNERIGRPPLPDLVAVHAKYEVDQCVLRYFERVEASYPAVAVINEVI
ncbi:hypothetical protein Purlil1_13408 [Purpureocillium lilacinum]|uniref:Uncharacterized protein n=1 Tax=Purpureocillium lilacinum TaxID=33203 RepID=A0ABR0BE49_PURLI|nr:hypothetical protein Purlil1_13408 [Purpureocillium lilacinum]